MPKRIKKQLAEVLPLVAIDIGSHSVRAMAAQKVGDDLLHVLGYEESSKQTCTEKGVVVQTSSASFMIVEVLKLLANRIGKEDLPAAFVLLGGEKMRVVSVRSRRDLARKHPITDAILEDMEKECKSKIEMHNPGVAVLGLVPAYYVLDGHEQEQRPDADQRAVVVEAYYSAFVGKQELREKVQASFDRTAKSIEQTFVRPEALLSAFSFEDQSVLTDGCAVLDMGAQTTTLSIFQTNQYTANVVSSKGGNNITQLIEQQGISYALAEKLKQKYGVAAPDLVEKNLTMRLPGLPEIGGEWKTTSVELATLIQQVLDEIINPLMATLNEHSDHLRCLYVTGGASMLQGIIPYLQAKTSVQVLYGSHAGLLDRATPDEFCAPQYASLVGALIMGSDYRDNHPGQLIELSKMKKLEEKILTIFTEQ